MKQTNIEILDFDYDKFASAMNDLSRDVSRHAREAQIAASGAILNR